MPSIPGIDKVRTLKNINSRSIPDHMAAEPYVNMLMLSKEKGVLEREGTRLDARREALVERLKEIENTIDRLRRHQKKIEKKRKFDWDATGLKIKEEADPEQPKKPKTGIGWKIRSLKRNI